MRTFLSILISIMLILLTFSSCSKSFDEQEPGANNDYFLNFNIEKLTYGTADQDMKDYKSIQEDAIITFQDVNSIDRHFYFSTMLTTHPDSITLLGSIDFSDQGESTFEDEIFQIEIFLTEARSNLVALSDTTYQFTSNEKLYDKLKNEVWGGQNLFDDTYSNQLFLTLPNPSDTEHVWEMDHLTSNGFYFENENLDLTTIEYNEIEDKIELGGDFDVSLKILSCGYYNFYHVSNADFLFEIK